MKRRQDSKFLGQSLQIQFFNSPSDDETRKSSKHKKKIEGEDVYRIKNRKAESKKQINAELEISISDKAKKRNRPEQSKEANPQKFPKYYSSDEPMRKNYIKKEDIPHKNKYFKEDLKTSISHRTKVVTFADSPLSYRDMILDSSHFIDKSLFIKEVIESTSSSILITRPRRWG